MSTTLIRTRLAANGRHEVICADCRHWFWLTDAELEGWERCPHCVGWWDLTAGGMGC